MKAGAGAGQQTGDQVTNERIGVYRNPTRLRNRDELLVA